MCLTVHKDKGVSRNPSMAFVSTIPLSTSKRRTQAIFEATYYQSARPWTQIMVRVPYQWRAHALHQLVGGQLSDDSSDNDPIEQISNKLKQRKVRTRISFVIMLHDGTMLKQLSSMQLKLCLETKGRRSQ